MDGSVAMAEIGRKAVRQIWDRNRNDSAKARKK
ncbi:hypothetical protein X766_30045 [Mesorhizobium sp. LSJC255A00]|nr:hypothetical protein X766_30045 [Mesorhizobium sp. LSJC255A00]